MILLFGQQGNYNISRPVIIISKSLLESQWQQCVEVKSGHCPGEQILWHLCFIHIWNSCVHCKP